VITQPALFVVSGCRLALIEGVHPFVDVPTAQ